jgi:hypothetical protein
MSETLKSYTVVFRAKSAVCTWATPIQAKLSSFQGYRYPITISFSTQYITQDGKEIPSDLHATGYGQFSSIYEAINILSGAASAVGTILALQANAALGDFQLHTAFDSTQESSIREICSGRSLERFIPLCWRKLEVDLLTTILTAVDQSPYVKELTQAIHWWTQALNFWKPGNEGMASQFLRLGFKSVLSPRIQREIFLRNLPNITELARLLGSTTGTTNEVAMEKLIFHGDVAIYKAFKPFDIGLVEPLNRVILERSSAYLRAAIIQSLELEKTAIENLLAAPFGAEPIAPLDTQIALVGILEGESSRLNNLGEIYIPWQLSIIDSVSEALYTYSTQVAMEADTTGLASDITYKVTQPVF